MASHTASERSSKTDTISVPFSALPLDPSGPPGNAWGRFGPDDQLGTLNLLTPATVAAAASEIESGIRISLDWPLDKQLFPLNNRPALVHQIKRRGPEGRVVNDDLLHFNTQSSSQWDGLRHYGYLDHQRYYNDTTDEQIRSTSTLGIDAWVSKGGIVGRGVLLDYCSWAVKNGITLSPFQSTDIPLSHLERLAQDCHISFHPGDILFVRSGFGMAYNALLPDEQRALAEKSPDYIGVEPTEEMAKWLWDNQFSAVAGDAVAFERSPPGRGKTAEALPPTVTLHQWLLGGWGMPIGELFDLEELASHCRKVGRWSFFLSSVPLKVPGGVASPPNAVAIF